MTSTDENEQLVQEIVGNVLSESVKEDQLQDMEENQQIDFAGKMDHDIVEVEGQITVCDENGCALDSPTEEEEKKEEHSGEEVAQIADEIGGLSLCDDDDNKIDAVAAAPTTDAVAEAPTSDAVAEAPTTDAVAEAPTTEQKATDGHVYDEPLANNEGKADNHPPPPEEEEQKEKMLVHAVVDDQTPNVVDDHTHATASDALPSLPPLSEPTNNTADNTYSNEANEIVSPTALEPKLLATSDEEEHQQQKEDALMANLSSGSGAAGEGTTAFNAVTPPPGSTVVPVEGQLQTEHQLRQHQQQAELCGAKAVHQQQNNGASSNRESVANDTDASSPRQIVSAKGGAEHSGGKTTHDGGSAGGKATEQKAKTKMCSIL